MSFFWLFYAIFGYLTGYFTLVLGYLTVLLFDYFLSFSWLFDCLLGYLIIFWLFDFLPGNLSVFLAILAISLSFGCLTIFDYLTLFMALWLFDYLLSI